MDDTLKWLQSWYYDLCDGNWEHTHGISIETIDNPGWKVSIDLSKTSYENLSFSPVKMDHSNSNWYHCLVKHKKFVGYGGPNNLLDIVKAFKEWTEEQGG